jgi:hypothetical protein
MILGIRSFDQGGYRGIQAILIRDWHQPLSVYGDKAFANFDEALLRLGRDPDATRIGPFPESSDPLKSLNTAASSALRSLPERIRAQAEFFTAAQRVASPHSLFIYWPRWMELYLESNEQGIERLEVSKLQWEERALSSSDLRLHVWLGKKLPLQLSPSPASRYFRLSELFSKPSSCALQLSAKLFV